MLEGRTLNDRYQVKKLVGGGGMANVYLGNDLILDREVAIKVLRLEYANDDEFIKRFHREAQAATSLSHPNIVSIYDIGEEDQIYYMVMEYIDGMTLKQYIQLHAPIELEEVLDIMAQISSAIGHAHDNGIIHRDIKPQNMLIDQYGQVKVTDFGIAVALSATALTQTNSVLGSIHYLSPEQARGGKANVKSDIYSLGIVMFEMITGTLPFSGQSAVSIALKHLQKDLPSIREWKANIPQSVENIMLKATTKDPLYRYQSAMDMENAVIHALDPEKLHEPRFEPPNNEEDGTTKAIPILKEDTYTEVSAADDETIVKADSKTSKKEKPKKEKKKKKRKKSIIWVTSLLVILCGAILLALFVLPSLFEPKDVKIPDVSGQSYQEALEELESLQLKVNKETEAHEEIEENHVIETYPAANSTVKEGKDITVYVSTGPDTVEFEDYIGEEYESVEKSLLDAGYQDVISYEVFSDQPVGKIISQHQPSPGDKVVPSNTKVIFEVSKGQETFRLNRLAGMTVSEAEEYLTSNDLKPKIVEEYHDEVEEGQVIDQNPAANEEVVKGQEITITVSKGPEQPKQVTHTESFTVPYTKDPDKNEAQSVSIYVGDVNHSIQELYQEVEMITEDTTFKIDLTIAEAEEASYKVLRDDELLIEKTISYEDVKGE
ncbi:Stk1 family PASTA domain-containing Ser/Thr kinase [Gracilibacillus dipsosauri]|uniref:Serine/threonine-protein kinase PrkC n=1 Tax=Gracilibacillus dipsosauri TaxID=178340 RepID=A0A317L011_9BACI|nr:Stk1 family PASTA domain-containing Ser/Thr kinase [Gracilibacillus dipsosauri]PWU68913.1 Stk1 family PASTA domain-containing Ser/Thr kinase [Gracilibacillus dipsosauri]